MDSAKELSAEELTVQDARLIGQYAVALSFASGHSTGIYTFRYLSALDRDRA